MAHTVESIKQLLVTNDKAVGRALVVLRNRQTEDEKSSETTRHLNGRGYRPCHARMGTSMANFFERNGYLSAKQVSYWRKPMQCGNARIEIYAKQLLEQANINAAKAAKAASKPETPKHDADEIEALTNTYEYLKKEYVNVVDSDSIEMIKPIVDAMREIEAMLDIPMFVISGSVYQGVDPDELVMMRMEAEADRKQTCRDEMNKFRARKAMERM